MLSSLFNQEVGKVNSFIHGTFYHLSPRLLPQSSYWSSCLGLGPPILNTTDKAISVKCNPDHVQPCSKSSSTFYLVQSKWWGTPTITVLTVSDLILYLPLPTLGPLCTCCSLCLENIFVALSLSCPGVKCHLFSEVFLDYIYNLKLWTAPFAGTSWTHFFFHIPSGYSLPCSILYILCIT